MIIFSLFYISAWAVAIPPIPFPIFLKTGFSTILEFEEAPTQVVLGDSQTFQVERNEKSLIIRPLHSNGSSNLFVYFKIDDPRLFVLSASDDAVPTYYKKFTNEVRLIQSAPTIRVAKKTLPSASGARLLRKQYDALGDFLVLGFELQAGATESIRPDWELSRLEFNSISHKPQTLWAERKEVSMGSRMKARMVFAKPGIPRDFKGIKLIIPVSGKSDPITLSLEEKVK